MAAKSSAVGARTYWRVLICVVQEAAIRDKMEFATRQPHSDTFLLKLFVEIYECDETFLHTQTP